MHGGPDALGAPQHDFSTNSNACGPCPMALAAVQAADATRYPNPTYTALRQSLADFHGVSPERVLLAGSASEFIFRITAWAAGQGARTVHLPVHHYGDYARAAQAFGLRCETTLTGVADACPTESSSRTLAWACEPSSPLGQPHTDWPRWLMDGSAPAPSQTVLVLDRVYAPLRLSGVTSLSDAQLDRVWQLFSPNKALGLTGVRAAYVIAPCLGMAGAGGQNVSDVSALLQMAPSWPVGAHGVAMLQAWTQAVTQAWLAGSLCQLRDWKARQIALLTRLGWTLQASEANFFCARPPKQLDLTELRQNHGIKLRDATSFGLPGWCRLGVLGPDAQDALEIALQTSLTGSNILENAV
ncbi:aminotransferase class I/II-fold pyridoxal phosphate-dependent enzyme [Rhodoferax sp.]|uniref:aminotransferase class I/II-fold pyridoxal phosphate-dependent enzyme n=1 Tax=Rhodoferax sp. TaxID=50421 RepID=UPI00283E9CEE|nr:aminotransferase class I/II-fold pyridoxal phosphate-dependent enzyme [Rhodoferax sp.]MDR3370300.1 aminotransferase class I/II-fold pyridoxal phosphate-dependent enzyme [Rhodoferax sp.]